jgi:hypothetical protein
LINCCSALYRSRSSSTKTDFKLFSAMTELLKGRALRFSMQR